MFMMSQDISRWRHHQYLVVANYPSYPIHRPNNSNPIFWLSELNMMTMHVKRHGMSNKQATLDLKNLMAQ